MKGRGSSVFSSLISHARTQAANRGLRAEGIPRLPPLRPIPFGRLCNSERRADRETKSKGWGQSTGPRSDVYTHTDPARKHVPPDCHALLCEREQDFSLLCACMYDI